MCALALTISAGNLSVPMFSSGCPTPHNPFTLCCRQTQQNKNSKGRTTAQHVHCMQLGLAQHSDTNCRPPCVCAPPSRCAWVSDVTAANYRRWWQERGCGKDRPLPFVRAQIPHCIALGVKLSFFVVVSVQVAVHSLCCCSLLPPDNKSTVTGAVTAADGWQCSFPAAPLAEVQHTMACSTSSRNKHTA